MKLRFDSNSSCLRAGDFLIVSARSTLCTGRCAFVLIALVLTACLAILIGISCCIRVWVGARLGEPVPSVNVTFFSTHGPAPPRVFYSASH